MSTGPNNPISWCDRTWNPVRGCSIVSSGCINCFAMKQAHRFSGPGGAYDGLTKQTSAGPQWTGKVSLVESALLEPLKWRNPQRVFVNSMSDLFHEAVPDEFIDQVFNVMAYAPHLTFQVLTKRPERMQKYLSTEARPQAVSEALYHSMIAERLGKKADDLICRGMDRVKFDTRETFQWPLPNVWLGVSCEDQQRADERIPLLLQTPAAVRFVSAEPLLGPIDFGAIRFTGDTHYFLDALKGSYATTPPRGGGNAFAHGMASMRRLSWVIVGGESGRSARPCAIEWIERIVQQCQSAAVPVFVKQLGRVPVMSEAEWRSAPSTRLLNARNHRHAPEGSGLVPIALSNRKGNQPTEWPEDLRVREFPKEAR